MFILSAEFNSKPYAVHQVLDFENDGMPTLHYLGHIPDDVSECGTLMTFAKEDDALRLADILKREAANGNPIPFRIHEDLEAYKGIIVSPCPVPSVQFEA